jgi:hypothetical protein
MPANPFVGSVIQMLAGGLVLGAVGALRGELGGFSLDQVSGRSALALLYLVTAGSIVAFTAYVWVLGKLPVSTVTTYAYVNPVLAVLLGAVLLAEPVGPTVLVGGAVIVVAVAVVVTAEGRGRRRARLAAAATEGGELVAPVRYPPASTGVNRASSGHDRVPQRVNGASVEANGEESEREQSSRVL